MSLKDSICVSGARWWIRYAPTLLFKERLWRFVHWRNHRYRARTRFGFAMRGHSNDLVQGYAYYFGIWEPNLTSWLAKRFQQNGASVFVDVGANVGYYSLLARTFAHTSSVVAIEASPMIFAMLGDNIRLNGFDGIRAVNYAVGAERGTLTLYQADDDNLGGTTTKAGVWEGVGVTVEARPLRDILTAEEVARTRLIKIDVEGAEWPVLEGLRPLLPAMPDDVEVVVEIGAGNADAIFAMFRAAGFHAYGLPNLYSYKCYLSPSPIVAPRRLHDIPDQHGDVIFSRRDEQSL